MTLWQRLHAWWHTCPRCKREVANLEDHTHTGCPHLEDHR